MNENGEGTDQVDVGRFALLLVVIVSMIVILALVGIPRQADDTGIGVRIVVTLLSGGVLFATIRVTRVSKQRQRWLLFLLGAVTAAAVVVFLVSDGVAGGRIVSVVWVLLIISAPALVLKGVLSSTSVTVQTILGAIAVYLLVGISLTFLAIAMDGWGGFFETTPRSTSYVYFSFVTITSLGYGDLAPFTDQARLVSITAAVISQMYLVIVVARLVSVWSKSEVAVNTERSG